MRRESLGVGPEPAVARPGIVWERSDGPVEVLLELGKPLTIGRDPSSTLVIDSPLVARSHAVIHFTSGQYILEDLQTGTGTRVNGRPVAQSMLSLGDVIEIAGEQLLFVDLAKRKPAAPPGGAGKVIRLAAVGLGTALVLVVVLRMLVPAEPPPPEAVGPAAVPSGAAPGGGPAGTSLSAGPAPARRSTDVPIVRDVVEQARKAGVEEADALFDEGMVQMQAGRLRDAGRLFSAVLERRPDHLAAANRLREAQVQLEAAIADAMTRAERARALLRYSEAISLWESVLEMVEPADRRASKALAGIEEARRHLGR
jgi:hypothetical protein